MATKRIKASGSPPPKKKVARAEQGVMVNSTADMTLERRNYYQRTTRGLLVLCSGLVVAVVVLTGGLIHVASEPPTIQDFAINKDMRVVKLVPLSQPLVTAQGLRNWVADSLRTIYSYDFAHYRDQLNSTRDLFTDAAAFSKFVAAVKDSGTLDIVKKQRLVVSSMLVAPPTITKKGPYEGRMSWRVEVPLQINYQSGSTNRTQRLLIHLLVQRVNQTQNARGLGITQLLAPRGN